MSRGRWRGIYTPPRNVAVAEKPVGYSGVSGSDYPSYLIKGVRLSKFDSKALEGIFVGYGAESLICRHRNKKAPIRGV